ncbi:oligosaccharyl transferase glycoprotein complex, beta subunit [Mucor velutinosus]|uniref:Oligosaccharyl transferase glycoprotein complex, beta subunit n=1 Tax=Mucor velutinosus TaxID=708070 RepID=A0AAN7DB26_9FUNG|nr:oligosaccharyl transferase glycoprotein complex, beta subunit [Mucor velutinosus]
MYLFLYDTETLPTATTTAEDNDIVGNDNASIVSDETRSTKRSKTIRDGREFFTKKALKQIDSWKAEMITAKEDLAERAALCTGDDR